MRRMTVIVPGEYGKMRLRRHNSGAYFIKDCLFFLRCSRHLAHIIQILSNQEKNIAFSRLC